MHTNEQKIEILKNTLRIIILKDFNSFRNSFKNEAQAFMITQSSFEDISNNFKNIFSLEDLDKSEYIVKATSTLPGWSGVELTAISCLNNGKEMTFNLGLDSSASDNLLYNFYVIPNF